MPRRSRRCGIPSVPVADFDRIGVINQGELSLVEETAGPRNKLGCNRLEEAAREFIRGADLTANLRELELLLQRAKKCADRGRAVKVRAKLIKYQQRQSPQS